MTSPDAYPVGLTARQRQLVDAVRFHTAPPEGSPCYVLPGSHGTTDLYVPVLYVARAGEGPFHARLFRLNVSTVRRAVETDAIHLGSPQLTTGLRGLPPDGIVAPLTVGTWRP